jgi:hypothetical protein
MEPPVLRVSLTVTPDRVDQASIDELTVRVRVENDDRHTLDLQLPASRLSVDGKRLQAWNLAIGNGARDARESALAPGEAIEAARVLGRSLVEAPGAHDVSIEVLGVRSEPVRVVVEPVA